MTLQVVAHLTSDAPRKLDAARQWLAAAIAAGADVIGGVPQYADEPLAFLDLLFEFAERSGLPLDMHIDEHLDPRRLLFDAVIERTRAHGMQGRVTAGHCCALSAAAPEEAKRIVAGLAEAGNRRRHAARRQSVSAGPRRRAVAARAGSHACASCSPREFRWRRRPTISRIPSCRPGREICWKSRAGRSLPVILDWPIFPPLSRWCRPARPP